MLLWLALASVCLAVTLRGVYNGGRTLNDHLMAAIVVGCFGVYGVLALGAQLALQGVLAGLALLGLGIGAALLVPPFVLLARRRDPGQGPGWWMMLASQPAYAFAFWGGCTVLPWSVVSMFREHPSLWPGLWLLPAVAVSVWGTVWALAPEQRVRRHRVVIEGLAGAGLRVAQLSDIHFSPGFPLWALRELVARVAALEPDLVVVTGDLVGPFSDSPGEHDGLVESLASLPAPVLFCAGNHDMPRWSSLGPELDAGGLEVLEDRAVLLELAGERVWTLGVAYRTREPSSATGELFRACEPPGDATVRLVLCHDPRAMDLLTPDVAQLAMAGHTHGGPVSLEMFGVPASILALTASHDKGLVRRDGVWHFTHPGNWLIGMPPRMGAAPEIVVFELVSAHESVG